MLINAGKHNGEAPELVVLTDPFYVKQILDYRSSDGLMPEAREEFLRLITEFDKKKLKALCPNCLKPAILLAFYKGTTFCEPWCAECSPFWLVKFGMRMDIFVDYISALEYVDDFCRAEESFYPVIIREIAKLKGLGIKPGLNDAMRFFGKTKEKNVSS